MGKIDLETPSVKRITSYFAATQHVLYMNFVLGREGLDVTSE